MRTDDLRPGMVFDHQGGPLTLLTVRYDSDGDWEVLVANDGWLVCGSRIREKARFLVDAKMYRRVV